jgi:hypothetical protein
MLERKHVGKSEAILEQISRDFSNAFAPKRLRQMAVSNFGFQVQEEQQDWSADYRFFAQTHWECNDMLRPLF